MRSPAKFRDTTCSLPVAACQEPSVQPPAALARLSVVGESPAGTLVALLGDVMAAHRGARSLDHRVGA